MLDRPSDDEVGRQILGVFMRYRIPANGMLQRNYFFDVRDGDFQRGINRAIANNWITIDRWAQPLPLSTHGSWLCRRADDRPGTEPTDSFCDAIESQYAALRTGLRPISNRSAACRNGNWKIVSRDWRYKTTARGPKVWKLPARDWGQPD